MVPSTTEVAPLLNAPPTTASSHRHFSAFPLTSHLHTPTLRLVSLHPSLSLTVSFLRVPEIHDGFEYRVFVGRTSTIQNVIDQVSEELGLTKSLPVPGGGALEYVLEEVWSYEESESMFLLLYGQHSNADFALESTRLSSDASMSDVIERPTKSNPFGSSAIRSFRICIPDEWFRRSKSRSTSSASSSYAPSEDTVRRLESLQESDEESEEEGGTAKMKESSPSPSKSSFVAPNDWRSSISQSRLSSMFDSWMHPTTSADPPSTPEKKVVSEPKLLESRSSDQVDHSTPSHGNDADSEFEQMLVRSLTCQFGLYLL